MRRKHVIAMAICHNFQRYITIFMSILNGIDLFDNPAKNGVVTFQLETNPENGCKGLKRIANQKDIIEKNKRKIRVWGAKSMNALIKDYRICL